MSPRPLPHVVNVRLSAEQYRALADICERGDAKLSTVVRNVVAIWLHSIGEGPDVDPHTLVAELQEQAAQDPS